MSTSTDLFNLQISDNFVAVREQVKAFIKTEINPLEEEFYSTPHKDDIWTLSARQSEIIEGLIPINPDPKIKSLILMKVANSKKGLPPKLNP